MTGRMAMMTILSLAAACGGCAERRLAITSEPAGATVWVNDVEVGRTPVEVNFTHYGTYDVRLRLDGYEPIATSAQAKAPWYEFVGADLVTEAIPFGERGGVMTRVSWNFAMKPALERVEDRKAFEADLLERAKALKSRLSPADPGGSAPDR
ncbi:MAG: PEGA domain-containing protein [Tepidisphaera sp.]